jgi:hypothetical protein
MGTRTPPVFLAVALVACSKSSSHRSGAGDSSPPTGPGDWEQLDEWWNTLVAERAVYPSDADVHWYRDSADRDVYQVGTSDARGTVLLASHPVPPNPDATTVLYLFDSAPIEESHPLDSAYARVVPGIPKGFAWSNDILGTPLRTGSDLDGDGYLDFAALTHYGLSIVYGPLVGDTSLSEPDALLWGIEPAVSDGPDAAFVDAYRMFDVDAVDAGDQPIAVMGQSFSYGGPAVVRLLEGTLTGASAIVDAASVAIFDDDCVTGPYIAGCTIGDARTRLIPDTNGDGMRDLLWTAPALDRVELVESPILAGAYEADDGWSLTGSSYDGTQLWVDGGELSGDGYGDVVVERQSGESVAEMHPDDKSFLVYDGPFVADDPDWDAKLMGVVVDTEDLHDEFIRDSDGPVYVVGDLDGDDRDDLLLGYRASYGAALYLGPFEGTIEVTATQCFFQDDDGAGAFPRPAGDANGDGLSDVATTSFDGDTGSVTSVFFGGDRWRVR